jgi:hypothetical protein
VAVYDTYASRLRREETAGQPDMYVYDDLPAFLRKQLNIIFTKCIGDEWTAIAELLDIELPTFEHWKGGRPPRTTGVWPT